jgi:hypothetical protein
MYLESKFQRDNIANEPAGQLFTLITNGQGQRSVTLPENQTFGFIFWGVQKIWIFFKCSRKLH